MNKNCQIIVKEKVGDNLSVYRFEFNDYRVATAISNLLCNIENVELEYDEYKKGEYLDF